MARISRRSLLAAAAASAVVIHGNGAPADPPPDGMVLVPAGPFIMGTSARDAAALARKAGYHPSWFSGETPRREVSLPAYHIDRYPVTNARYAEFCKATGYAPPRHWGGPNPPASLLDHPVVCVNRADCLAFCRWADRRLPSEAEWEKAARGTAGLVYPWGDLFKADACCWNRKPTGGQIPTEPVTAHPGGASPFGVMDLVGNAAEWCSDSPGPGAGFAKGGCWILTDPVNLRAASRAFSGFDINALDLTGFRCAQGVR